MERRLHEITQVVEEINLAMQLQATCSDPWNKLLWEMDQGVELHRLIWENVDD